MGTLKHGISIQLIEATRKKNVFFLKRTDLKG